MINFALIKIEAIKGENSYFKYSKNGKCLFDDFEKEAVINYRKEVISLYYRMDALSRRMKLPETQMKLLKGGNKSVKEFEIKTKHLRFYAIREHNNNIIILGGYKINQKKDINLFRNIVKQYLDSKE